MRFEGLLYRALTPRYAAEPLSGEGARLYGGRFNARGTPALYLATDFTTALNEANQVGLMQPTTLVTYIAEIENLFDARDPPELARMGIDEAILSAPGWRDEMRLAGIARSQELAAALRRAGHPGMAVRSFARGNLGRAAATNVVLWVWPDPPAALRVVDDHGRLAALKGP